MNEIFYQSQSDNNQKDNTIIKKEELKTKKKKNVFFSRFFSLIKVFKKETIIFFILATLSCISSQIISNNSIKNWFTDTQNTDKSFTIFFQVGPFGTDCKKVFKNNDPKLYLALLAISFIYSSIVFLHIWFFFILKNKVIKYIKEKVYDKLHSINSPERYIGSALLICNSRAQYIPEIVFFIPNQIYISLLGMIMHYSGFISDKKSYWKVFLSGFLVIILIVLVYSFLSFVTYKKSKVIDEEQNLMAKKEEFLISRINLITKKSLYPKYKNEYVELLKSNEKSFNARDALTTLTTVIPSHFFLKMFPLFFVPFMSDATAKEIAWKISDICKDIKQLGERTKNLPIYLSSFNETYEFLELEERDNNLKEGKIIKYPIEKIIIEKISFSYSEGSKQIFKDFDMTFSVGNINHLIGRNGFGKSTLMNLIMGLLKPQKGEILIDDYKLSELNLLSWRKKIVYCEHNNLVVGNFSTGQKQLIDIEEALSPDNLNDKFLIIFDEADNAVDKENKKKIWWRLEEISKKKIVIIISH